MLLLLALLATSLLRVSSVDQTDADGLTLELASVVSYYCRCVNLCTTWVGLALPPRDKAGDGVRANSCICFNSLDVQDRRKLLYLIIIINNLSHHDNIFRRLWFTLSISLKINITTQLCKSHNIDL